MKIISYKLIKGKATAMILWLFLVCRAMTCFTVLAVDKELILKSRAEETSMISAPLENLSLFATSAVLMDADSGRVLYEKDGYTIMPMASTTKIMTCILALEYSDLEDKATVSGYASGMPKVKLYVKKGEGYALKDLLYSLMLESHNDSAVVIAEHIGKQHLSEELQNKNVADYTADESGQAISAFAALMNRKAREIGCEDTWFITPNGLDASEIIHMPDGTDCVKEHSTTAADLARIMSYCINESPAKEQFLEITRTRSYSFTANERSYTCVNHNAFLSMMEGALSGKTGFTNKSGYCYVGALRQEGKTFVVALLACGWPNNKNYKWTDTRKLMEYGLKHYETCKLSETAIDKYKLLPVPVMNGCTRQLGGRVYVNPTISREAIGSILLRKDEQISIRYTLQDSLQAPVTEGTEIGYIEYLLGETVCDKIPVLAGENVEKISMEWCIRQIILRYLL